MDQAARDGDARRAGALAVERPSGRRPLQVVVAPLAAPDNGTDAYGPAAAAFVSDPDARPGGCVQTLMRLYELTPSEARVAMGVVQGVGLRQVADGIGVSLNTVRTHLQHVFQKTGTRRQAELAQVLIRGPLQLQID